MNTREELNEQLDAAGETPETRAEGAPESFMEAADLHCYGIELDLYSLNKMVWRGGVRDEMTAGIKLRQLYNAVAELTISAMYVGLERIEDMGGRILRELTRFCKNPEELTCERMNALYDDLQQFVKVARNPASPEPPTEQETA